MASNPSSDDDRGEKRHPRINKPDMFMNVALWMEMSPLAESPDNFGGVTRTEPPPSEQRDDNTGSATEGGNVVKQVTVPEPVEPKKLHKSGAVFVLPNDRALSVDCSKAGVHAAISGLNKFGQERAKGCQVYLSRRPCSFCAKLLVQCEVSKVYYLPLEPEWNDPDDVHRVDNIFKASSTGLSIFITKIKENVMTELKDKASPFAKLGKVDITEYRRQLENEYWSDDWIRNASEVLRWHAFCDTMKIQTDQDMKNLIEWIARATYANVPDGIRFAQIDPITKKAKRQRRATGEDAEIANGERSHPGTPQVPTTSDDNWQIHALHMCRMAQMLSQRSDDPTNRVGCILILHNEVVAIGWNGFPAKTLYGEFPRATASNQAAERKEHYVIHAEQNALLTRNKRNLKDDSSTLYTNKVPAREVVPMLIQAGVKNIVVPQEPSDEPENHAFFQALKSRKLVGFWPIETNRNREASSVKRRLSKEL